MNELQAIRAVPVMEAAEKGPIEIQDVCKLTGCGWLAARDLLEILEAQGHLRRVRPPGAFQADQWEAKTETKTDWSE